jgi:spore germination protein KB
MNKDNVNDRQFMLFVTLFTIGSSILFIPHSAAATAKQDSWLAILIGMGGTLGLIWLYIRLARNAPGCTMVEMNRKWLGKWLGPFVSILYLFNVLFLAAASLLHYLGDFMVTKIMTQTPMTILIVLFALVVAMGLRMGLGTLARAADVFFLIFAILFAAMIVFLTPEMKAENMQPAFAGGVRSVIGAAFDYVSFSGMPIVFMLMIYPSVVADSPKAAKAFYMGSLLGGFFLLIITVVCISVLGVENTVQQSYPSYALAKQINIGNILTRIEVIMATLWIISLYFKLILYCYAGIKGIAQLLGIGNERILVLPIGALVVVFSIIIYPDTTYRAWWDSEIWPSYSLVFGLFLPVLLLMIAKLRKKTGSSK